ncbi:unnamed protein product [Heterosigma akashiwo]
MASLLTRTFLKTRGNGSSQLLGAAATLTGVLGLTTLHQQDKDFALCERERKEKATSAYTLDVDHTAYLEKMTGKYNLPDSSKTLRVLLEYAIQEGNSDLIYGKVRCKHRDGANKEGCYGPAVRELNSSNFDSAIASNDFTIVLFQAPWCPFCEKMVAAYSDAAAAASGSRVAFAQVDCTKPENEALGKRFAQGYPTILAFPALGEGARRGASTGDGPRTAADLGRFAAGLR